MRNSFALMLKPSWECPLRCLYCDAVPHSKGRMPAELGFITMKQYMAASVDPIVFWSGGEPLLMDRIWYDTVLAGQNPGTKNAIQTAGTLIDEKWARWLSERNFMVGVSLDGPPVIHEQARQGCMKTVRGIQHLKRADIPFNVQCVVSETNIFEARECYEFFRNVGATSVLFIPILGNKPGRTSGAMFRLFLNEARDVEVPEMPIENFEGGICHYDKRCGYLAVDWQGSVFPCEHEMHGERIGNVKNETLGEIFLSDAFKAFQERKEPGPACGGCDVIEKCNGGCTLDREDGLSRYCAAHMVVAR